MKTFSIYSLGCKVNQYDGQLLREHFLAAGFTEKSDIWEGSAGPAVHEDVFVLNTCTVTAEADKECARIIRKVRRLRPATRLIVTGCAVSAKDHEILRMPDVDLFVHNQDKGQLMDLYALMMNKDPEQLPPAPSGIQGFQGHCRAFVKIQDGCNEFCTFCKIPFVRGRNKSRPAEEIRAEVQGLLANGYQEIVFTGVHAGHYGLDLQHTGTCVPNLADLVAVIHDCVGLKRIRFSSLEPMNVSPGLIERLSAFPKVCPHFHLPLQSGDDAVLRSMRRRYTVAQYKEMIQELRVHFYDVEITTDIIVGFPGETDAQFEHTLRMLEELQFLKVHGFPYSVRPGTLASGFADKIPAPIIRQRADVLTNVAEKTSVLRRQRYLGQTMEVLVEGKEEKPGVYAGFTANYLKVFVPGDSHSCNQFRTVRLVSLEQEGLAAISQAKSRARSSLPIGY